MFHFYWRIDNKFDESTFWSSGTNCFFRFDSWPHSKLLLTITGKLISLGFRYSDKIELFSCESASNNVSLNSDRVVLSLNDDGLNVDG